MNLDTRTAPLAFVHTAAVHMARFDALLASQAPGLRARHWVDTALLDQAQAEGAEHPDVVARTQALVRRAAEAGARVVVCTCSTVGAAAEATPTGGRWQAQRVDRAMADQALLHGPRVLLVAALASTLAPTATLLASSAQRLGRPVQVQPLLVPDAWACFGAGDLAGYLAQLGRAVRTALRGMPAAVPQPDAVVLAQASMADLVPALADLGRPVLSSPALGVARALASVYSLADRAAPEARLRRP